MTAFASLLLSTKARARSKVSCARMLAYRKLLRSGSAAASRSASRLRGIGLCCCFGGEGVCEIRSGVGQVVICVEGC